MASLPEALRCNDVNSHSQKSGGLRIADGAEMTGDLGRRVDVMIHRNSTGTGIECERGLKVPRVEVLMKFVFWECLKNKNKSSKFLKLAFKGFVTVVIQTPIIITVSRAKLSEHTVKHYCDYKPLALLSQRFINNFHLPYIATIFH